MPLPNPNHRAAPGSGGFSHWCNDVSALRLARSSTHILAIQRWMKSVNFCLCLAGWTQG